MSEPNEVKTTGIVPSDPEQPIPVKNTTPADLTATINIKGYDSGGSVWRNILVDTTGKIQTS